MALGTGFVTGCERGLAAGTVSRRSRQEIAAGTRTCCLLPAPVGPGWVSGLSEFGSGKPFQESAEQLGLLWECTRQPQSRNPLPPISKKAAVSCSPHLCLDQRINTLQSLLGGSLVS